MLFKLKAVIKNRLKIQRFIQRIQAYQVQVEPCYTKKPSSLNYIKVESNFTNLEVEKFDYFVIGNSANLMTLCVEKYSIDHICNMNKMIQ